VPAGRCTAAPRHQHGFPAIQPLSHPHRTALESVTIAPIKAKKISKTEARSRGEELLAIARALAREPELMLFDEPIAALDAELVGEVLEATKQLAADGTTMIVITHEVGFAREVADALYSMDEGVIVDSGDPRDLLSNPQHEPTRAFVSKVL
jgi:polar amino acid transport system ATP-binding protein